MKREIHRIYDTILKIVILTYSIEFLKYIGEEREIKEILQTEISTMHGRTQHLDFLCKLEDDSICHIEFQFPVAYIPDLTRFFDYNIKAQIKYDGIVDTLIFNFTSSTQGACEIDIGETKSFHPKMFYLGDVDFKKELETIINKVNKGESENVKLTYQEELNLMLMPLAFKYKDKKSLLKPIVELLRKDEIFHKEKIDIIKSIIKLEVNNFLSGAEKEELKGDIQMNQSTEEIFKQVIDEVNKKYEQEAYDMGEEHGRKEGMKEGKREGMKEGKKEGIIEGSDKTKREIAKKLKGKLSPEEISKITGLSVKTILIL